MLKCTKCGAENADNVKFCHICGTRIAPPSTSVTVRRVPQGAEQNGAEQNVPRSEPPKAEQSPRQSVPRSEPQRAEQNPRTEPQKAEQNPRADTSRPESPRAERNPQADTSRPELPRAEWNPRTDISLTEPQKPEHSARQSADRSAGAVRTQTSPAKQARHAAETQPDMRGARETPPPPASRASSWTTVQETPADEPRARSKRSDNSSRPGVLKSLLSALLSRDDPDAQDPSDRSGAAGDAGVSGVPGGAGGSAADERLRKLVLGGACGAVVLILLIVILCLPRGGGDDRGSYLPISDTILITYIERDGNLAVVQDGEFLETRVKADSYYRSSTSMDGSRTVLLSDSGDLYLIENRSANKIADGVLRSGICADGSRIWYIAGDHGLYLIKSEGSKTVTEQIAAEADDSEVRLSPSGTVVLYATNRTLMAWSENAEKDKQIGVDVIPISATDDGKTLYVIDDKQKALLTADVEPGTERRSVMNDVDPDHILVNASGTECLFRLRNGETFLSANGGEPIRIAGGGLAVIYPEPEGETASSAGYLNVVTFRNIAVRAVDQSSETDDIGYLNAEYVYVPLEEAVSEVRLSGGADQLLCVKDGNLLRIKLGGEAGAAGTKLAENAADFRLTEDGKTVFYLSGAGELYKVAVKGGKAKKLMEGVGQLGRLEVFENQAYVLTDGGALYRTDGKTTELIRENAQRMESHRATFAYIADDLLFVSGDGVTFVSTEYQ